MASSPPLLLTAFIIFAALLSVAGLVSASPQQPPLIEPQDEAMFPILDDQEGERDAQQQEQAQVPFVPTPSRVIDVMLRIAGVGVTAPAHDEMAVSSATGTKRGIVFIDVGCGDGRIAIAAAKAMLLHGKNNNNNNDNNNNNKVICIERDPELIENASQNAQSQNVSDVIDFYQEDFFHLFEDDTLHLRGIRHSDVVVAMYLLPGVVDDVASWLFKLLPATGTKILSVDYPLLDHEAEVVFQTERRPDEFFVPSSSPPPTDDAADEQASSSSVVVDRNKDITVHMYRVAAAVDDFAKSESIFDFSSSGESSRLVETLVAETAAVGQQDELRFNRRVMLGDGSAIPTTSCGDATGAGSSSSSSCCSNDDGENKNKQSKATTGTITVVVVRRGDNGLAVVSTVYFVSSSVIEGRQQGCGDDEAFVLKLRVVAATDPSVAVVESEPSNVAGYAQIESLGLSLPSKFIISVERRKKIVG